MPQENLLAYTASTAEYPPFVSINRQENGDIAVTVRGEPTVRDGSFVCSYEAGAGRCKPGGPNCNNYCNKAPQKGPMQDKPLPCRHVDVGQTVQIIIPAAEADGLISQLARAAGGEQ